jgi:SP family general alpha glucoside:H+ symporter-like MFS transporter
VCSSIALKVLADNEPTNYLTAVYTEWAMLGIMGIVHLFIPESPYWCAGKGNDDRGRKIIEQLNGDIEGYDVDGGLDGKVVAEGSLDRGPDFWRSSRWTEA